ncbi:MAG: D-alanine--D-alanine ligase family protein, partial [Pseudomonadota bacterium]
CEDGKFQGLIENLGYKLVGCGTLSSAVGMDKNMTKIIAQYNSIPVVPWVSFSDVNEVNVEQIVSRFGLPVFVKPASSGSSFGTHKVKEEGRIIDAVKDAFKYSDMVLIEKAMNAREIEAAVLGHWNRAIRVSVPGEIIPRREFYDYEAKYVDKVGADLVVPAEMENKTKQQISKYAETVFKVLKCSGLSRVDFFLDRKTGDVFFSEINTIPGFTVISMYPKLWDASGIPYKKLLDELINIAAGDKN